MELRYCEKCGDIIKLEGKDEEINPAEHFVCPRCSKGDEGGQASPKDSFDSILDQSSLNLFSPSTLALKRREMGKDPGKGQGSPASTPKEGGTSTGSSFPARTARKLQFRCLHCHSTLMIRPVEKPSRIVCPKCKGNLFIDQTGIVSKKPPVASAPKVSGPPQVPQAPPREVPADAPPQKSRSAAVPRAVPKPSPAPSPLLRPGKAGLGDSTQVLKTPIMPPKPASVRRMPSSIQRTFTPAGPAKPEAPEKASREPRRQAEAPPPEPFHELFPEVPAAKPKTMAKPKKEAERLRESEGFEKSDLFRGLSITPREAVPHEEASASIEEAQALLAPEGEPIKDFEDLEGELAQVEDFTKPLTEGMSPAENIAPALRSRRSSLPEPVGALKKAGVLLLTFLLASLMAAPLFLVGHLSVASGTPSKTAFSSGSQRPAFERLGKIVEKGKGAILSLPARWTGGSQDRTRR